MADETDATRLRELIARAGLGQRAAAEALGVNERVMRRYCAGKLPVPRVVLLAASALPAMEPEKKL
jgi:hypothetical protein